MPVVMKSGAGYIRLTPPPMEPRYADRETVTIELIGRPTDATPFDTVSDVWRLLGKDLIEHITRYGALKFVDLAEEMLVPPPRRTYAPVVDDVVVPGFNHVTDEVD